MKKNEDKGIRYFIEIDLESRKAVRWGSGDRFGLISEVLPPHIVRIYITKGQYNKLI